MKTVCLFGSRAHNDAHCTSDLNRALLAAELLDAVAGFDPQERREAFDLLVASGRLAEMLAYPSLARRMES